MRPFWLGLTLALACDGGTTPAATPDRPETPDSPAAPEATPSETPPSAEPEMPTVALPELSRPTNTGISSGLVAIWMTTDALWVGRTGGATTKLMALSEGELDKGGPELVEELAVALTDQWASSEPPMFGGVHRGLVLFADANVSLTTLRRVLTTARATGFRELDYAVTNAGETQAVHLLAGEPVDLETGVREPPPTLRWNKDSLTVNHRPFERAEAVREVAQRIGFASNTCALLQPDEDVRYREWISLAASLADAGVECVSAFSPAASADVFAPPPPPPPPPEGELEDEGLAPAAAAPPPPVPEAKSPLPPRGTDRVEHWWKATRAEQERVSTARCKKNLGDYKTKFDAEDPKTSETITILGRFEGSCGDPARRRELQRLQTELFPEDVAGWLRLGQAQFEPLFPDPATADPFRRDVEVGTRFSIATEAIGTFDTALKLAPENRDLHVWASMAHLQRKLAAEGATSGAPALWARVDTMKTWQHQKWLCDHDDSARLCTDAPQTEAEHAADVAALAKLAK